MSGGLPCALQQELLWGSQCGSQRAQTLSYIRRRQANVVLGEGYARRCQATSGGWVGLIWEQEAAGSNPAIPTDQSHYSKLSLIFFCFRGRETRDARCRPTSPGGLLLDPARHGVTTGLAHARRDGRSHCGSAHCSNALRGVSTVTRQVSSRAGPPPSARALPSFQPGWSRHPALSPSAATPAADCRDDMKRVTISVRLMRTFHERDVSWRLLLATSLATGIMSR
jgi:hypothetical protein